MAARSKIVAVLNVTPDSFTDGGLYYSPDAAIARGLELFKNGADIVDIGGDSTRPGSICTGPEEEWRRIEPVLKALAPAGEISVDTHHPEVADRAISAGAAYINDTGSENTGEMLQCVAASNARYIGMYSRCPEPHHFAPPPEGDIVNHIKCYFEKLLKAAADFRLPHERMILDPGMGGFIHTDPAVSYNLLERFAELEVFHLPLMVALSRKGFLIAEAGKDLAARDELSFHLAIKVKNTLSSDITLYIRTHRPDLHNKTR